MKKRIGIFGKGGKGGIDGDQQHGDNDEDGGAPDNNTHEPGGEDVGGGEGMIDIFKKHQQRATNRVRSTSQENVAATTGAEGGGPANTARPSYRTADMYRTNNNNNNNAEGGGEEEEDDDDEYYEEDGRDMTARKLENIEKSAGTSRLNRILRNVAMTSSAVNAMGATTGGAAADGNDLMSLTTATGNNNNKGAPYKQSFAGSVFSTTAGFERTGGATTTTSVMQYEKISNVRSMHEVSQFCSRIVVPPLKIDSNSIGGNMLDSYPESMLQECLLTASCEAFESTGTESVVLSALQYPNEYSKHKRSLGLIGGTKGTGGAGAASRTNKIRYVLVVRSTNRPILAINQRRQYEMLRQKQLQQQKQQQLMMQEQQQQNSSNPQQQQQQQQHHPNRSASSGEDHSDRGDYDAMFAPEDSEYDDDEDDEDDDIEGREKSPKKDDKKVMMDIKKDDTDGLMKGFNPALLLDDEEVSSFPALVCMTLQSDGTGPDIRKLVPLDQLTTVQDLHSTVVQLAFSNGDTIRLEFGDVDDDKNKVVERPLDKERFIWSLLQIHAMLCMAVVERNTRGATFLPPLNVRNLDRAELQYIATINGFLKKDEILRTLLDRQRKSVEETEAAVGGGAIVTAGTTTTAGEGKMDISDMETMAYNLMMGNFATRVTLFHSEDERKDAEEILNSTEWTDMLNSKEETAAVSVAERLGFMLQSRMRDLEAETCRRLIAWEDEKHLSLGGRAKLHDVSDARDTVDALALASLFKTLESLDTELKAMEDWLQDRAAAIKPLTDDCADIEEENRQLEQQWKSYDMLGAEMRRLLHGQELDETTKAILRNPASVLVYDDAGLVDVEESELGIERIYESGKALLEALEFPKKSGGIHLKAVSERAHSLASISSTFCSSLAQIIVTVMEQFKTIVVAGSDGGKVSKNDTHTMISTKVRDTQRKFQSALLSYIKLIEILAALSPDMLPALRDAYAEMVSEGILMKKRMKGYFQALPGKNAAFLNKVGKDLKDYVPFNDTFLQELVNAPDIRAVLNELLPVIAREAYFTSALFGSTNREQDGREKKRNFENAKNAVDKASVHFRYYMNRTCGIVDSAPPDVGEGGHNKGDPLLCFVATIYLNEAMDNYVDRDKKGGDHSLSLAYVRATILDLRKKADKQWVAWVEEQIAWIKTNEGVPMNGKRAGIFPSFARFPVYLDHAVVCCKQGREEGYFPDLPGIKVINYYLQKMAVTLLDSLKDCARRETTDQSYAANVMEMENTYFFTQSIKERGEIMEKVFAKQVTKANAICKESTDAYLGWMIKREFTALHELFSKISNIRKENGDSDVINQVPKAQFIKIMQKEANRDVMKEKIGAMFSRMEKHLSEEGDLLSVAWKALVKVLYEWFGRWEKLCTGIYRHKLDPSPVDVVRIAKAAGGAAKPKVAPQGTEFGFKSILALGNKQGPNPPS